LRFAWVWENTFRSLVVLKLTKFRAVFAEVGDGGTNARTCRSIRNFRLSAVAIAPQGILLRIPVPDWPMFLFGVRPKSGSQARTIPNADATARPLPEMPHGLQYANGRRSGKGREKIKIGGIFDKTMQCGMLLHFL
jgi:hypothetical protein